MTFREYECLQVGDKVILPFSSNPEQIVVRANNDMVETKPEGSAHETIIYNNHYKSIVLNERIRDKH